MLYFMKWGGGRKHPKTCHGFPPFIKHLVLSSTASLHMVSFGSASLSLPHRFSDIPSSSHHPSWLAFLLPYFHSLPHPFPPIIYLPSLPLSISPSPTSCFPACQTVIINEENDSPPGPRESSPLTALREWNPRVCVCAQIPVPTAPPD